MTVPDEELFAFVDGELPPEAMARIEAALEGDPQLALRVETQRALRRLLSGSPMGAAATSPQKRAAATTPRPGPAPKVAEVIAFPGAQAKAKTKPTPKSASPRVARPKAEAGGRGSHWMMIGCLVAGLAIGRLAAPSPPTLSGAQDIPPTAAGPLVKALNSQASGQVALVKIGLSFKNKAGLYCRTFQASGQTPVAGVACREASTWRLRVVSFAGPGAVRPTVDALIAGQPLDAADEARAKAGGWKAR
ncbi:anti-sigma factor [Caulobacter sp. DWP3-1-3b2]|uniref:anti-sigma factor n=1 Tax=Caulobacter sp. DWP3-1-3b2 TaxID=2804643 RepID=UPI003CEE206D